MNSNSTSKNFVIESHKNSLNNRKHYKLQNIDIFVKDPLPDHVDINNVLRQVELRIPSYYLYNIDAVYVGEFQDLIDRDINAKFADGAIYITNEQDNDEDMIDDFIHEIAHATEVSFAEDIYADGLIEEEFLGKRRTLRRLLKYREFPVEKYDFEEINYTKSFDELLYVYVGYKALTNIVMGLFVSPYAATSIREYYASGFEDFYLNNGKLIRKISPALYEKLSDLNNLGEKTNEIY